MIGGFLVTREANRSAVKLNFRVIDIESDPVAVRVDFAPSGSTGADVTFTAANLVATFATTPTADAAPGRLGALPGLLVGLSSSPAGIVHRTVWDADAQLPPGAQQDVVVRITPVDPATLAPIGEAALFGPTIGNDAPELACDPLAAEASGAFVIAFHLVDTTNDLCRLDVQYARSATATSFTDCTISVGQTRLIATSATAPGPRLTIAWDTEADLGRRNLDGVVVRLVATDPFGGVSQPVTATVNVRNNFRPVVRLDAFDPTRAAGSPLPIAYTVFDTDPTVDVRVLVDVEGSGRGLVPATERPALDRGRPLSESGRQVAASRDGVQHTFLWDLRADVTSLASTVRLEIIASDAEGDGVTVSLPPLKLESRFPLDLERGEPPNTDDVRLARLDLEDAPWLVDLAGGRLLIQEPSAANATFAATGYDGAVPARRFDLQNPAAIRDVDGVRVGRFDSASGADGIVGFRGAGPAFVQVYHLFSNFFGDPGFDIVNELTLADATAEVMDVAAGDFDADGFDDVAVLTRTEYFFDPDFGDTVVSFRVHLYRRDPSDFDFGFLPAALVTDQRLQFWFGGAARLHAGDVDADGKTDLVAAFTEDVSFGSSNDRVYVALNGADLGASAALATSPFIAGFTRIDLARLDGAPGREIVLTVEGFDPTLAVFRLRPGPALEQAPVPFSCAEGRVLAVGDLDGDGLDEMVVYAFGNQILKLREIATDAFDCTYGTEIADSDLSFARGIAAAIDDIDGDGRPDVVFARRDGTLSIFFGIGGGALGEEQALAPAGGVARLITGDLDGDGDVDVVAASAVAANLLRNPGPLAAEPSARDDGFNFYLTAAVADVTGDGRPDVVGISVDLVDQLVLVEQGQDGVLPAEPAVITASANGGAFLTARRARLAGAAGGLPGQPGEGLIVREVKYDEPQGYHHVVRVLATTDPAAGPRLGPPIPGAEASTGLEVADLDGDGLDDLICATSTSTFTGGSRSALEVCYQLPGGDFAAPVTLVAGTIPFLIRTAALDPAGTPGFACVDYPGGSDFHVSIWRAAPGGVTLAASFVPAIASFDVKDALLADVTGDGRADLVLAHDEGSLEVHPQDPAGGFSLAAVTYVEQGFAYPVTASLAAADVDGDGRPEIVRFSCDDDGFSDIVPRLVTATVSAGGVAIGERRDIAFANGGFKRATPGIVRDFDGDGRPDVALPTDEGLLFRLTGSGRHVLSEHMPLVSFVSSSGELHGPVVADATGDGNPEIVGVSEFNELVILLGIERRPAATQIVGPDGGVVASRNGVRTGASVTIPGGARPVARTLALLPAEAFPMPPVSGTAVVAGFAAEVHLLASPPIAVLPEAETLTAAATLELPIFADVAARYASDAALEAALRVFRFEPEAAGGAGRTVPVPGATVVRDAATNQARARVMVTRLGRYQAAVVR